MAHIRTNREDDNLAGAPGSERNEPQEDGKIFIGGLNKTTTKESIEQYCREWGEPKDVVVMDSKGYGFVSFIDIQDAFRFLERGQHSVDGKTVDVKAAMPRSRGGSKEKGLKMFIGGLPRQTSKNEVMDRFSQYGEIDECNVVGENSKGPRGFAFVTFRDTSSMEKALIVKHCFHGKAVECKRAMSKEEHEATNSSGMRGGPQGAGGPAPRGGAYGFSPDGKYQGASSGYGQNGLYQNGNHSYGHGSQGRASYPTWKGGGYEGAMNMGYTGEPWMGGFDNRGGYNPGAVDRPVTNGAPGGFGYSTSTYEQGGYGTPSGALGTDGYNVYAGAYAGVEDGGYGQQQHAANGFGQYGQSKEGLHTQGGGTGYGAPRNDNNGVSLQSGAFGHDAYANAHVLSGGYSQGSALGPPVADAGYGAPTNRHGGAAQNGYSPSGGPSGPYGGGYNVYNMQQNRPATYGGNGMPGPPSRGGYSGPPQRYTPY